MMFSSIKPAIGSNINAISKRFARKPVALKSWPNDWVPFHWSRPESVPGYYNTGDLKDFGAPDSKDLRPEVRASQELKKLSSDDPLRKLFSVDHGEMAHHTLESIDNHVRKAGLIHAVDKDNSLEFRIIFLTYKLRQLHHMIKSYGDRIVYYSHFKTKANNCKFKRYGFLCQLKEQHIDRWRALCKALDIDPPDNLMNIPYEPPFRKVQMRRLAIEYANKLVEEKIDKFLEDLEEEKVQFQEEKEKTLKWIEEQSKLIS